MSFVGKTHVYTGDGKGKTTAALGLMLRFAATGRRIMFIQFMKSTDSGEIVELQDIDNIALMPNPWAFGFSKDMTEEEVEQAKGIYRQYLDMIAFRMPQGNFGMMVMDEVLTAIDEGFVNEDQIMDILDQVPDDMEIVLTGRNASQRMIDRADYVTEMKKIKHPFDQGLRARKGIEY